MSQFVVGWVSFALTAGGFIAYLAIRQLRRVVAWADNKPGPHERVRGYAVIIAIGGFLVGSLVQAQSEEAAECRASGASIVTCLVAHRAQGG